MCIASATKKEKLVVGGRDVGNAIDLPRIAPDRDKRDVKLVLSNYYKRL